MLTKQNMKFAVLDCIFYPSIINLIILAIFIMTA